MRRFGRFTPIAGLRRLCWSSTLTRRCAQQGSLQVSTAVQTTARRCRTGSRGRTRSNPTSASSWLQPGSRFGVFQIEIRGARRGDSLHTGRMYGALRDAEVARRQRGRSKLVTRTSRRRSTDYGFSNLFTPAVTFNGARRQRPHRSQHRCTVVAGKTTAWRNIFGNDPKALGQSLGIVHSTHRSGRRLEVSARASRVRTSSLEEFSYTIDASDQAGGGARFVLTPSVQLVADASLVSYRRTGTTTPRARWIVSGGPQLAPLARMGAGQRVSLFTGRFSGAQQSAPGSRTGVCGGRVRSDAPHASVGRMGTHFDRI